MNTLNNPTLARAIHSKEASIMKSARKRAPSIEIMIGAGIATASPRRQGGWTIVEIMIGAGIASALAIAVFSNFGDVVETKIQTDAMTEIQDMRAKVQSWRNAKARRGSTTTISVAQMISDGVPLSRYTDGVAENAYGKDIALSSPSTGSDWVLSYGTKSSTACAFLSAALTNDLNVVAGPACTTNVLSVTFD